ncbi:MAG: glucose-6-phosphate isomerase [Chloroflexi bacterium HGW-Chloroflexi-4]|jgi:glucose-6-phosphate isomerase|nr:MAG: glucose-6-phosphate isomerase [Chloroflexi bacterium HGW-Chloroflexi-7]PKN98595.1 MAG: glucose-6-phosphate isomerase [Chloroflexi bacterium HGW-Chloroflexi-4]
MSDLPFSFTIPIPHVIPSRVDNHIKRTLSALKGQFLDEATYNKMLNQEDSLIYEVYEIKRPEVEGELLMGISIVHPGKVGNEFFMTKGHFHSVLDTSEIYYTLKGEGYMVMETPEGETSVEPLSPGKVLYVPPRWAHRSVCTSRQEDLVTFFAYPANAGHDYGTIEKTGFRKLVVEGENGPEIIDNPRVK